MKLPLSECYITSYITLFGLCSCQVVSFLYRTDCLVVLNRFGLFWAMSYNIQFATSQGVLTGSEGYKGI